MRPRLILGLLLLGGGAVCAPSGLITVPTADILPSVRLSVGPSTTDVDLPTGNVFDDDFETQIGIARTWETGVDIAVRGNGAWWNGKYRLFPESIKRPALAVGVQNVGTGSDNQPYVVGFKTLKGVRLHTGAIAIQHRIRAMLGVDHRGREGVVLMADYISGGENFLGLGASFDLPRGCSASVARLMGNSSSGGNGWQFGVSWTNEKE